MKKYNYLNLKELSNHDDSINCYLSNNLDEDYYNYFPKINKKNLSSLIPSYPDSRYKELKERIIKRFELGNIVLNSGGESGIIILNQIGEKRNWKVAFLLPIFYRTIETFNLERKVFLSEKNLKEKKFKGADVVWINNPNLFTGKAFKKNYLIDLIGDSPHVFFFIDEAAIFSIIDNWRDYSLLSVASKYHNLVVISSFSKMYGLAGLRVGFATGSEEMIEEMRKRNLTFPITSFSEYFLLNMLKKEKLLENIHKKIKKNKKEIKEILSSFKGIRVDESVTNCIYLRNEKTADFYKKLLKHGIVGLDLNNQLGIDKKGCIRITIHSSKKIHRKLKKRIKKILTTENEEK